MTTLKISDLSVGDWVEIDHEAYGWKPAQLNVCGDIGVGAYFKDIDPDEEYDCTLCQLRPIPITAEMLEKNGFVRGKRGAFYHYLLLDKNRTLYVHASTNGWRVEITYDAAGILRTTHLMPDMNSVHDLQHALRLAGVDKEINL